MKLTRLQRFLAVRLGINYAAFVQTVERAGVAFFGPFLAALIAKGFDITDLATWKALALAGLSAAATVVQSVITAAITGTPEALSLVSRTLRYRRDLGARPLHDVPLRAPRRAPIPAAPPEVQPHHQHPLPYPHPED